MNAIVDVFSIIGLFALRLGVPLAITGLVVYLFKKMDEKWEAESQSHPTIVEISQAASVRKPCWEDKGCSPDNRAQCPACRLTDIPCWLARLRQEYRLPVECTNCVRYAGRLAQTVQA